jgi:hypothetical protein
MTRQQNYDNRERIYREHLNWCARCGRAVFHRDLCRTGRRYRSLRDAAWLRLAQLEYEREARRRRKVLVLESEVSQ